MTTHPCILAAACAVLLAGPAHAQGGDTPTGTGVVADFASAIPNIPGKSIRTELVTFAPGAASAPHTHAPSAFIMARVLEGEILSGVNGAAPRLYRAGESWTENPGDRHTAATNASRTRPARLLAVFVVDTAETRLTRPDAP